MKAVEMLGITKSFGSKFASSDIDFHVEKGEIHSLLGENGAGKTTLMNILFGMIKPDSGKILLNEKEVKIDSPLEAIDNGISMVHQHFMLVDNLTVAENIVLGAEPHKGILFDREGAFREIQEIADRYHFVIDPREMVGNLSVGIKQRVEILKALYHRSDILILDEPTAVLTPQEVNDLFKVLNELKADGKTIIIITHKLKETMAIADSVTILRRGELIGRYSIKEVDEQKLADLMVGRLVNFSVEKKPMKDDMPVKLSLKNISLKKNGKQALNDLSLEVHAGEILGVAGVEGNGQSELIEVLTGVAQHYDGTYMIGDADVTNKNAKTILKYMANIAEDRRARGYVKSFTNWENMILGYHTLSDYMTKAGFLKTREIRKITEEEIEANDIRTEGPLQLTDSLSGGNVQKLIVARMLRHQKGLVLAAQPTRGVDIGAIEYIHGELIKLRDAGAAVILISAELDEIVKLSDRIAVLYEGRVAALRKAEEFTESELGSYMLGHDPEKEEA